MESASDLIPSVKKNNRLWCKSWRK